MTLLLDTHVWVWVWVWAVEAPEKLGRRTKALLQKSNNDRILVATARLHQATLLTADERILAYPHVRTEDCQT
jgi:PIN domain nuclease of toxin-antitoxin system